MSAIAAGTREIVAMTLGLPNSDVTDAAVLADLGADSLDLLDAVLTIEKEFGIEMADDELESVQTVGDLVKLVVQRVG